MLSEHRGIAEFAVQQRIRRKIYDFLIGKKGRFLIANFGVKDFGELIYYP